MKYSLVVLVFTLFISCSSNNNDSEIIVDFIAENEQEILGYISDNNLVAQKSQSGLYYVIDELGTGSHPTITSNVTLSYRGYLTDGSVFDQNDEATFDMQQLISGFAEGVTYFKEGGNGILLIPSRLAYGNDGIAAIPGGAVIIFDIGLISVN